MPVEEITRAPQAEAAGRERSADNRTVPRRSQEPAAPGMAKFLGWFSIGLGVAEFVMPNTLASWMGTPRRPKLTRLMGLREIAAGAGILGFLPGGASRVRPWVQARVAGDAIDLALLGAAFRSSKARPGRLAGTSAFVAAVTVADLACAQKLGENSPGMSRIHLQASLAVNRSPEDCYRFWRQLENLPSFMEHVREVQVTGEKTSKWKVQGTAAKTFEWDAEITEDVPGERIGWRSLPGGSLENAGSVEFEPSISGRGTMVRVSMAFAPSIPGAGFVPRGFLRTISKHEIREDLRRFKSVIEAGEAPTTKGQTSGRGVE